MSKTNKSNLSGIIFLVAILAITLFLVIFVFINVGKPFVVKDFSDMKQATVENYKTIDKKHDEYYVLVYNFNSEKDAEIEEVVLAYANYARTTSEAKPIYAVNYQENKAITNSNNLNITDANLSSKLPTLVLIKKGTVSSSDTASTVSKINQTLVNAMNK